MPNSAPHGLQFHKGDVRPNRLARAPYMRSSQADLIGSAVSGPLHIFSRHAKKYGLALLPETGEIADSNSPAIAESAALHRICNIALCRPPVASACFGPPR